jgi:hypothetical protein
LGAVPEGVFYKARGEEMGRTRHIRKVLLISAALLFWLAKPSYALDVTLAWDANQESDLRGYKIYYDTDSGRPYSGSGAQQGNSPIEMLLNEDEDPNPAVVQYTVHNLPDGIYYFAVTATDTEGLESDYSNEVKAAATADTAPPVISNVGVTYTSDTTAVIVWTTDEPSNSQVQYGPSSGIWGSYPNTIVDNTMVTNHTVTVTGLLANVTYYFSVGSTDASGNADSIPNELTFKTNLSGGNDIKTATFGDVSGADYPGTCQDTYINSGQPAVNSATDSDIRTYTWPDNTAANRIIIKWDLSAIPPGATIQSATLSLYMYGTEGSGGDDNYDILVHRILNHNPSISACTWNTFDGVKAWSGGADGGGADLAQAESTIAVGKTAGYKTWSITQMLQDWVNNPATNFGLALSPDGSAASDSNRYFRSTEYSEPDQRPKLTVTYSLTPAHISGLRIGRE